MPFARVVLGGVVARTRTVPRERHPSWGETLTLDFSRGSSRFLVVEVWDEAQVGEQFMGHVRLPLANLGDAVRVDRWFTLGRRTRYAGR